MNIVLDKEILFIDLGEYKQLTATIYPPTESGRNIIWSEDDSYSNEENTGNFISFEDNTHNSKYVHGDRLGKVNAIATIELTQEEIESNPNAVAPYASCLVQITNDDEPEVEIVFDQVLGIMVTDEEATHGGKQLVYIDEDFNIVERPSYYGPEEDQVGWFAQHPSFQFTPTQVDHLDGGIDKFVNIPSQAYWKRGIHDGKWYMMLSPVPKTGFNRNPYVFQRPDNSWANHISYGCYRINSAGFSNSGTSMTNVSIDTFRNTIESKGSKYRVVSAQEYSEVLARLLIYYGNLKPFSDNDRLSSSYTSFNGIYQFGYGNSTRNPKEPYIELFDGIKINSDGILSYFNNNFSRTLVSSGFKTPGTNMPRSLSFEQAIENNAEYHENTFWSALVSTSAGINMEWFKNQYDYVGTFAAYSYDDLLGVTNSNYISESMKNYKPSSIDSKNIVSFKDGGVFDFMFIAKDLYEHEESAFLIYKYKSKSDNTPYKRFGESITVKSHLDDYLAVDAPSYGREKDTMNTYTSALYLDGKYSSNGMLALGGFPLNNTELLNGFGIRMSKID
jgi:hypothetical protein